MNTSRLKPEKKIDELLLLLVIRTYKREHMGWPPTAGHLFDLRRQFAPSLSRIDTLYMWLLRHTNRSIRRIKNCRPFRYELTRQGEKRIAYLQNLTKRMEDLKRQIDDMLKQQTKINITQQFLAQRERDKKEKEREFMLEIVNILIKRL